VLHEQHLAAGVLGRVAVAAAQAARKDSTGTSAAHHTDHVIGLLNGGCVGR
jgi:hypothetical protein